MKGLRHISTSGLLRQDPNCVALEWKHKAIYTTEESTEAIFKYLRIVDQMWRKNNGDTGP